MVIPCRLVDSYVPNLLPPAAIIVDLGNIIVDNGAAVTVGALAVVLLVFVCFLSALWILRKLHILCWSTPRAARRTPPPPSAVHFTGDRTPDEMPTAPFPNATAELVTPDKDPPPAYDMLFPPKPSESRPTPT